MHSMSPPELYNQFSISMHRRIVQSKNYIPFRFSMCIYSHELAK